MNQSINTFVSQRLRLGVGLPPITVDERARQIELD